MAELKSAVVEDACRYAASWLDFQREHHRLPGVQCAVRVGDDVVLSLATGLSDLSTGTALTPDHRFRIASHSKTFTATAVMQLVEAGILRLDDTVGQWVPELAGGSISAVTLRQLLSHSGGVIRDGDTPVFWQLDRPFPDRAALLATATTDAAVLSPNEKFKYSNVGYSLLGLVIENASGTRYHDWCRTRLIEPLELRATAPEIDDENSAQLAAGHTATHATADGHRLVIEHVDTRAMAPATGFVSTATDLVQWFGAHFTSDERLLGADSKREMQHSWWEIGGSMPGSYGFGLGIDNVGDRRLLGHGGGYPGHITRSYFDPEDRLAVAVCTNAIDGPAVALASAVVRLIDLARVSEEKCRSGSPSPQSETDDLEGRYATLWGVFDLAWLGGRLHMIDPTLPDPVSMVTVLEMTGRDSARIVETNGYGAPGEALRFVRADDGNVRTIEGASLGAVPIADLRRRLAPLERISAPRSPT